MKKIIGFLMVLTLVLVGCGSTEEEASEGLVEAGDTGIPAQPLDRDFEEGTAHAEYIKVLDEVGSEGIAMRQTISEEEVENTFGDLATNVVSTYMDMPLIGLDEEANVLVEFDTPEAAEEGLDIITDYVLYSGVCTSPSFIESAVDGNYVFVSAGSLQSHVDIYVEGFVNR